MFSASLLFAGLIGTASASTSKLDPMGNNTYAVTREASSGFDRDVGALKSAAKDDAAKFCASQKKEMKVLAVTTDRPHFGGGFASAKVVFKALDAGDPELTAAPPPLDPSIKQAPGGDLYAELIKLEDLHQRGILTDKEFNAQKKKILKRSN